MLRVSGAQAGTGSATRRPVSCAGSATVKRSAGKAEVSGASPVSNLTGTAAADASGVVRVTVAARPAAASRARERM